MDVVLLFVRFSPSIFISKGLRYHLSLVRTTFAQPLKVFLLFDDIPVEETLQADFTVLSGDVLVLISPRREHPASCLL